MKEVLRKEAEKRRGITDRWSSSGEEFRETEREADWTQLGGVCTPMHMVDTHGFVVLSDVMEMLT